MTWSVIGHPALPDPGPPLGRSTPARAANALVGGLAAGVVGLTIAIVLAISWPAR